MQYTPSSIQALDRERQRGEHHIRDPNDSSTRNLDDKIETPSMTTRALQADRRWRPENEEELPIILFLNKIDVFKNKLPKVQFYFSPLKFTMAVKLTITVTSNRYH